VLKKGLPVDGVAPASLNTFQNNKPIKVVLPLSEKSEKPSELNLNDCEIGKLQIMK